MGLCDVSTSLCDVIADVASDYAMLAVGRVTANLCYTGPPGTGWVTGSVPVPVVTGSPGSHLGDPVQMLIASMQ